MTARFIKTATSWKIPHEKDRSLFFAALQRLLPWLRKKHEGMISLVKRRHMMCHVKNNRSREGRRMERFVCFPSNVTRIGEEDKAKRKKVTITSRKKRHIKETKQKIKRNKRN